MKFKMQSYPKEGRGIMKKGHIILGVILLIGLFVFIPGGVMGGTIDECSQEYSSCLSSCPIDRSVDFINATDTPCHRKCEESYIECSCGDGACGLWYGEGYRENCLTCPEDCQCPEGWMCNPDDETAVVGAPGSAWNSLAGCVYLPENGDVTGGTGDADAVCGDGLCETDKEESCANCLSDCPCSSGEACQPSDSNADAFGCVIVAVPKGMALTVSTNKKTYSPEETVIVSGSVQDAKSGGPISGANVVIDINPTVSTTTDSSGNYKKGVTLPSDISQGTHTVTVTASKTGYPDVSGTTSFSVEQALIVEISTDQLKCESLLSLIGKNKKERKKPKIYCTITVKNAATGKLVPYANLKVITTRLCTRKVTELSGFTDGIGENTWSFTLEERLKIEVTASMDGYSDGHKSIIFPEDCFWSPEVCKCDANMICDPWSEYADLFGCSPKVAYIILRACQKITYRIFSHHPVPYPFLVQ